MRFFEESYRKLLLNFGIGAIDAAREPFDGFVDLGCGPENYRLETASGVRRCLRDDRYGPFPLGRETDAGMNRELAWRQNIG